MIRLFVALALPDDCRDSLARLAGGLPGARWVPPGNFHVTLRFIGEVDERDAETIAEALAAVRGTPPTVRIAGLGLGGDSHRAHTLWAEIARDPALVDLQARIERAVAATGAVAGESRRFRPHVTLARFSGVRPETLQEFLSANPLPACPAFVADGFGLYSSVLSRQGSVYAEEVRFPLAAGGDAGLSSGKTIGGPG